MNTPRSLGGLETDPVTRALVVEEIGRHDSAAAWTLENPLDWAFFCARLPDEGAEEIYSHGADILIAAQFGRPLKATSTNGGYRISGQAPFVSNCRDADWFSSTVLVDEDSAAGEPEMRMVYFPREGCEIIDTWNVMGMRGTGSHDISVTDVYVPKFRTFPMEPDFEPGSHYRGPLYRLPVDGRGGGRHPDADAGGGATSSRRGHRTRPQQDPGGVERPAKGTLHGAGPAGPSGSDPALRTPVASRHAERKRGKDASTGETHSLEQRADLLLGMAHAMSSAVQAVELACSIAGTTAFRATSPLERCFRDVQTMRHHVFASEQRYGTFGQVYLGVEPDFPVVAF